MKENLFEPIIKEKEKERGMFYKISKGKFAMVFDEFQSGSERVENIILESDEFLDQLANREEVEIRLRECENIQDRKKFVEAVFGVLKFGLDMILENPNMLMQGIGNRKLVNEMLSYEIKGDCAHIHVFTGGWEGSLKKFTDGLKELAKDVEKNENIQSIEAFSWIVAEHPKILKRLGFIINGEVDEIDAPGLSHSKNKKEEKAHMARSEFLKRYLSGK